MRGLWSLNVLNNTKKNLVCLLIYIIILTPVTYALLEWYITPVVDGMVITFDYFNDKDQPFILEITNLNSTINELQPEFTEKFLDVVNDESLSVEESVDILQEDLNNIVEIEMIKAYKVMLFLFVPILTLPAVVYFHVRFWLWVCSLIMRVFKIDPRLKVGVEPIE